MLAPPKLSSPEIFALLKSTFLKELFSSSLPSDSISSAPPTCKKRASRSSSKRVPPMSTLPKTFAPRRITFLKLAFLARSDFIRSDTPTCSDSASSSPSRIAPVMSVSPTTFAPLKLTFLKIALLLLVDRINKDLPTCKKEASKLSLKLVPLISSWPSILALVRLTFLNLVLFTLPNLFLFSINVSINRDPPTWRERASKSPSKIAPLMSISSEIIAPLRSTVSKLALCSRLDRINSDLPISMTVEAQLALDAYAIHGYLTSDLRAAQSHILLENGFVLSKGLHQQRPSDVNPIRRPSRRGPSRQQAQSDLRPSHL